MDMELKKYQFIGQAAPFNDQQESDIDESDDEMFVKEMSNKKFIEMIREQVRQIFAKENSIDVTLLNMRSWKHEYDKDHTVYLGAILPAVFNEVALKSTPEMSKKDKFEVLKTIITDFKEMLQSFA